jgi:hypothetical protein
MGTSLHRGFCGRIGDGNRNIQNGATFKAQSNRDRVACLQWPIQTHEHEMGAAGCQFQLAPGRHGKSLYPAHARYAAFDFRTVHLHVGCHTG